MAVYEVTGPNGEVYEIEGPDDADPSAVIAQITGMQTQAAAPADESGPSLLMAPVGGAELLAMGATGLLAQVPAGLAGLGTMAGRALGLTQADPADVVRDIEERLTYVPRSESAQSGLAAIARGVEAVERAVNPALAAIGRVSPTAENVVRTVVPAGLEALATVAPLARVPGTVARTAAKVTPAVPSALEITRDIVRPVTPQPPRGPAPPTAEQIVSRMDTQQSMGAAAAAPSLVNVSPELRQAIVQSAQRTGGAMLQ